MNIQEQKKYHQRKLAIIEMIEICEDNIRRWVKFISEMPNNFALENAIKQKNRQENIKNYLLKKYKE